MIGPASTSLRTRLILFAVLCAAPVFTLLVVQRATDEARIRAQARADVALAATQLQRSVAGLLGSAEALGRAVAAVDMGSKASLERCNEALGLALEGTWGHVLNYALLDLRGNVVCSGRPATLSTNLGDRPYFREAIERRAPTVSGHIVSRLSRNDSVVVAVPRLDERGEPTAVVATALSVRPLTHTLVGQPSPGMVLALFDAGGKLLSRFPENPQMPVGHRSDR
ncbi:MAG: hypothetical protein EOO24_13495 [Comamonadaceae bacterium]|nr:MAG: hypothetical protein EOO24_13495 [Comamonadaceae bacterium]